MGVPQPLSTIDLITFKWKARRRKAMKSFLLPFNIHGFNHAPHNKPATRTWFSFTCAAVHFLHIVEENSTREIMDPKSVGGAHDKDVPQRLYGATDF